MVPASGCLAGGKVSFQIKDRTDDTKDQLKWKWTKGAETTQPDFGDPLATTTYALCVYDHTGGVPALATTLEVPPNSLWQDRSPKGWKYKDKTLAVDGIQKIQLKPGTAGKSKAQLMARGTNIPMPTPVGADRYFAQDPAVIVQLVNSDGVCWTSEFNAAKKNAGDQYKAKGP